MKKKIYILIIALIITLTIVGTSYGYLRVERETNNTTLTLDTLNVILLTDIENVTMDNLYPMTDEEGLKNEKVTFKIQNTETIDATYKVRLVDKNVISTMLNKDVRYQLSRKNETTGTKEVLPISNLDDTGLIDSGVIEAGDIYTYELIMWIEYNANPNGLSFAKVIQVEGIQIPNLDTSGANFPEILDNMIPVYYDKTSDTEGVWRVADSKNLNTSYQWFDYNNYMWANAVTVKETSSLTTLTLSDNTTVACTGNSGVCTRDDYLKAQVGTIIPMEDITTMWVWIPRYKYVIWAGNNNPSEEQLINVEFEHGIDKTGTVTCVDNILTATDSNTSQTCTDSTYGSIVNNQSTYTHPAFTFGDEELTGFWMAKFEMSTDDENSVCTSTSVTSSCNINDLNVIIKPDTLSLRYQRVSNEFATIRRMELYDNIHGFSQDSTVTSHLDSNGYLTGDIKNDSNNFDTHMIKNMEWGAVAYLSYSKYGKWSNPLYTGDYRRVYKNNYDDYVSSGFIFRTGYSSGTYNGNSLTNSGSTFLYNDMTIATEGRGYRGAGASTTGTVYGIYDMNGGAYDYVMGNIVNSSGNFYPSYADTWSTANTGNIPNDKYYDKYSYNTSSSSVNSQMRGKLGDATKEVTTTFGVSSGGWGGVSSGMPYSSYSWFSRGGSASVSSRWGVMYQNNNDGGSTNFYSSRPSLVVSREFPWLSE